VATVDPGVAVEGWPVDEDHPGVHRRGMARQRTRRDNHRLTRPDDFVASSQVTCSSPSSTQFVSSCWWRSVRAAAVRLHSPMTSCSVCATRPPCTLRRPGRVTSGPPSTTLTAVHLALGHDGRCVQLSPGGGETAVAAGVLGVFVVDGTGEEALARIARPDNAIAEQVCCCPLPPGDRRRHGERRAAPGDAA
jgi:hypothetical protein